MGKDILPEHSNHVPSQSEKQRKIYIGPLQRLILQPENRDLPIVNLADKLGYTPKTVARSRKRLFDVGMIEEEIPFIPRKRRMPPGPVMEFVLLPENRDVSISQLAKKSGFSTSSLSRARRTLMREGKLPFETLEQVHARHSRFLMEYHHSIWGEIQKPASLRMTPLEIIYALQLTGSELANSDLKQLRKKISQTLRGSRSKGRVRPLDDTEKSSAIQVFNDRPEDVKNRVAWWLTADEMLSGVPDEAMPRTRLDWMATIGHLYDRCANLSEPSSTELFKGVADSQESSPLLEGSFRRIDNVVGGIEYMLKRSGLDGIGTTSEEMRDLINYFQRAYYLFPLDTMGREVVNVSTQEKGSLLLHPDGTAKTDKDGKFILKFKGGGGYKVFLPQERLGKQYVLF